MMETDLSHVIVTGVLVEESEVTIAGTVQLIGVRSSGRVGVSDKGLMIESFIDLSVISSKMELTASVVVFSSSSRWFILGGL